MHLKKPRIITPLTFGQLCDALQPKLVASPHQRLSVSDASSCGIDKARLDAYQTLLLDVIEGDHSLFLRYDEVNWAWRVVDPILKEWSMERDFIHTYPAGSWGPEEASRLFTRDDQHWRNALEED